jgi:protein-L-isoaspartate O-methyltransferase
MADLATLRALLDRGDGSDRAFVDAMIRMGWSRTSDPAERADLEELHTAVKAAALRSHTELRAEIAKGSFRGAALRRHFDDVPLFERDHFVEEVLGIAYPPLQEPVLAPELLAHAPSGYDEIVHALDVTRLAPGDRFLDIGSGMGKAVMLAELLAGATSTGVECHGPLHAIAETAAHELALRGARYHHGDARDVVIEDPDVVFMYLPFTGSVLAAVMARLVENSRRRATQTRRRFLCAGPLDTNRYPDLVTAGPPRSWLHVYTWR